MPSSNLTNFGSPKSTVITERLHESMENSDEEGGNKTYLPADYMDQYYTEQDSAPMQLSTGRGKIKY